MTVTLLNFAVAGLLYGLLAAAAVELLSVRRPRLASLLGTAAYPFVALAPLLGAANRVRIPVDNRRLDALATLACIAIALLLVARDAIGHLRGARERRGWTQAPAALRQSFGIDAVYVHPAHTPGTHGIFRRAIVIPSRDVARAVLLHERAHYAWRDPAVTACRRLLSAALWFHPGLRLLERSIRQAGELAADAAAVATNDPAERTAFASLLIATARSVASTTALGAASANDLETRVRAILGCGLRRRTIVRALVLAGALAALPLLPHLVGDEAVVRHVIRIP